MATGETNNSEMFFQAVSTGSVAGLQEILKKTEPNEKAEVMNSLNSDRETPLLVAIKGNHHEMVKFLVEELKANIFKSGRFKWKGIDYEEALPLFVAIVSDYTGQLIVNFLLEKIMIDFTVAVDFVGRRCAVRYDRIPQTIDMLELMGAAYIMQVDRDVLKSFQLGITCWNLALNLRDVPALFSNSSFLKPPNRFSASAQQVFGPITEFQTEDELQEICNSPEIFTRLQTQAVLVIQRIMSRLDPDPHPFFLYRLLQYGWVWFGTANQYSSSVDVVIFILELLHSRQWKDVIDFEWCHSRVLGTLKVINYSRWMKKEPPPDRSQLPFDRFMVVINYVSDLVLQLQKHPNPLQSRKATELVEFISNSMCMFTEHEKAGSLEFKKWLAGYIKFTNSHPGVSTVLHVSCHTKTVQLFLDGKADPNAKDELGNTPLHYLAFNKNFSSNVATATKLLLVAGAHLDQCNNYGCTALDLFKGRKVYLDQKGLSDPYINALTRTVLPLSCLSAQVIRQNSIPYQDQQEIPSHLIPFIQRHSAKRGYRVDLSNWFNSNQG